MLSADQRANKATFHFGQWNEVPKVYVRRGKARMNRYTVHMGDGYKLQGQI